MKNNPHANAVKQLEQVAEILRPEYADKEKFDQVINQLKKPDNFFTTELEVKMDNGEVRKFMAFRSQHNNARGPYKGGVRYHPNVSEEEVKALSTWMTWKCSVANIPLGGGKGGIVVDPKELSPAELERLSRAYARFLKDHVGSRLDVPAPDVNTTGQIMSWFVDELIKQGVDKKEALATFTGKPLENGGSEGREEATGLGGVYILEKLVEKMNFKDKSAVRIAVQGFGNVGFWFAKHAHKLGYKVVAVSDSKGGIYLEDGLDPDKTLICKSTKRRIDECMCNETECSEVLGKKITNQELLELEVDILVPSALENVITEDNAAKIKAKAIIEMANGPITPEADAILEDKKIITIPDVLSNSGGVTVSYFEWLQNLSDEHWSREEVLKKLRPLMEEAFDQMWQTKSEFPQLSWRMATYLGAVKRVVDAQLEANKK